MMLTVILSTLIGVISLTLFGNVSCYQIANRSFFNIQTSVFETSLVHVDSGGNPVYPYFNKKKLNENISNYFYLDLSSHQISYTYSILYLNKDEQTICLDDKSYCFKLSLQTDNLLTNFSAARIFAISQGELQIE